MSYLKQPSIQGELPSAAKKYGLQLCNMFVCWVMSCLKQLLCGPDVQKLGNVVAIVIRVGNPEIMQKKKAAKNIRKKTSRCIEKTRTFLRKKSCSKHGNALQIHQSCACLLTCGLKMSETNHHGSGCCFGTMMGTLLLNCLFKTYVPTYIVTLAMDASLK